MITHLVRNAREQYGYVLVSDDDVVLLKEIHDILNKYRSGFFCLHVVALCVSEAKDVGEGDTDSRFSC